VWPSGAFASCARSLLFSSVGAAGVLRACHELTKFAAPPTAALLPSVEHPNPNHDDNDDDDDDDDDCCLLFSLLFAVCRVSAILWWEPYVHVVVVECACPGEWVWCVWERGKGKGGAGWCERE